MERVLLRVKSVQAFDIQLVENCSHHSTSYRFVTPGARIPPAKLCQQLSVYKLCNQLASTALLCVTSSRLPVHAYTAGLCLGSIPFVS